MNKKEKEIEKLAEAYLKKVGSHDRPDVTKHDFIEGVKAGYAASTPSPQPLGMQEENLYLWNGIDGELEEMESFEHATKWLKENYTDPQDGIHPDIESCELYKKVGYVSVNPVEGKDTFIIEVKPLATPPEDFQIAYVPCDENDPRVVGGFTSADGQSLCHVREMKISEQGSDGWISVEDRLPQKMEEVLFTHTDVRDWGGNKVKPSISFGWYDRDKFHSYIDPRDNWSATHWMPLPPTPPQSKE